MTLAGTSVYFTLASHPVKGFFYGVIEMGRNPKKRCCQKCGKDFESLYVRKKCYRCFPPVEKSRTLEECKEIARKYTNRTEFLENEAKVYYYARKRGWHSEICIHMSNHKIEWTLEYCKELDSNYQTVTEFSHNHSRAYVICLKNNWSHEVCGHMEKYFKHSEKDLIAKALMCKTRSEFGKKFPNEYESARRRGLLGKICTHMKFLVTPNNFTKTQCLEKALLFETRTAFRENCRPYYSFCLKNKWLDEVCSHMENMSFQGWSDKRYIDFVKKHHDGICNFYLIECQDEFEQFITFGVTVQSIRDRYKTLIAHYDWHEILIFESKVEDCIKCEQFFKTELTYFKYVPEIQIDGLKTESLKISNIQIEQIMSTKLI